MRERERIHNNEWQDIFFIKVLWNTIIDAALDQLRKEGFLVNAEDVIRLSPNKKISKLII